MKNIKNEAGLDDGAVEEMFKYQDLTSGTYSAIENIAEKYPQNGLTISLSKAYFMGMVNGKRSERLKRR